MQRTRATSASNPKPAGAGATVRFGGLRITRLRLAIAGGIVLLLVAAAFDETLTHALQGLAPQGTVLRRLMRLSNHPFRWWTYVGLAVALLGHPLRRRLLVGFAAAVGSCMACLWLVKIAVGRARPDADMGPLFFDHFGGPQHGFDSFPSGHATQAVLLMALLGLYFPRTRWVLAPLAVLVCLGRVALDRHYVSDVIGGAALALLTMYSAVRLLGRPYYPRLSFSDWRRRATDLPAVPPARGNAS